MGKIQRIDYIIVCNTKRNNDFQLFVKMMHKFLRRCEDIGYHYLIRNTKPFSRDGKLYFGIPEEFEGAHTQI